MKSALPLLAFLCLAVLLLGGCASTSTANSGDPGTTTDANGQPVSTIPWNKPASWESGGALGAALGQ